MAIEAPIDNPRLFVLGASVIPLLGSYITAVLVRWLATRRGFTVDVSKYLLSGVVLSLHVIIASSGGVLLEIVGGIPSGIGIGWTIAFLVGIYVGPMTLGLLLFDIYLLSHLDIGDAIHSNERSLLSTVKQDGILIVIVGSNLLLFGIHILTLPSFFIFSVAVTG